MSPQKKPAAKPMARKIAKKISGAVTGKTTKKASPRPLKKVPPKLLKKLSPEPSKKALKKLDPPEKSGGRIEEIINSIGAGIYMTRKGKFVSVSSTYEQLTGYAAADLIGKNFLDYVHREDRAWVRKNAAVSLKKKNAAPYEYRFVRNDGDIMWVLEIASAGIHQGEQATLGSIMDITRYKQTEDASGLKEERYHALLEETEENYYEIDLKGNFTFVNDALVRHMGYSKEELIGMNYRQYSDAKTAQKMRELYSRLYQSGKPFINVEGTFITKGGAIRFVEISGALIRDKLGKPVGFRGLSRDFTDRKQMENELRKSEERYRTILEEINEGCSEFDLSGTWTFANEAAANILGYAPAELIGKNYKDVTDEDAGRKIFHAFNNLYQTGKSFKGVEAEFITKQGIRRVNEISGALLRDEKGQPVGFRALGRDITERKWAEDALLQSEARYFSIIESIGDAYFETDLTGMTTFVNDKACEDLGYTREELLHMSNRDLQDEASAQETYAVFNEVYETGRPFREFQYKVNRKDGTRAIFEMAVSLMRDADGKPIGFRGLSRDITERKKMEDALKASEARARTLIATIPDPYVERDLQGRAVFVNDAYVKLSGYSSEELRNMPYSEYLDAENAEIVSNTYQTVLQTGLMMKNVEIDLITKQREKRRVNLSASLILDSQGNPSGFQSIIRDITDVKKAQELIKQSEQSLREYSETLERRVKERTAELEKAKIAAEAASRAKSDFMANISHEFQTPLNAVIGFTKVLQDRMFGELSDKQEEFVRFIADAGASLSRIITEIVDASQVSSGRIKLKCSSVSITDLLSQTTRLLVSQIEEKKQILTVDVDLDADITIEADEQKIQQALFHLMSNAVKYTDHGGEINVKAARTRQPVSRQEGVSIAVRDTGIGIKAEDMSKLFQAFGTLESPYSKTGTGIGIGLSLTKQLVELHGGTVSVESKFGHGSCFTVFLPLKQKQTGAME